MSNVVFIIGNGLNFLVKHIIDELPIRKLEAARYLRRSDLSANLGKITVLWKKFDAVFEELRQHFVEKGNKISDEELIKLISSVINFFSNLSGFEKVLKKDDIEKLRTILDGFLLNQIVDIANEFREHEAKKAYSGIREYFKNFEAEFDKSTNKHDVKKVFFFTTNYDGILDVLFFTHPSGFNKEDGFRNISSKSDDIAEAALAGSFLGFFPKFLQEKKVVLCHIHGSYKFVKNFGKTYKIIGTRKNTRPVIVFNRPDAKNYVISNDNVLSEYMRLFTQVLQSPDTKRLVILGNSMEAEPHLKAAIRDYFSIKRTEKEIVLVSREPNKIAIELDNFYKGNIIEKSVAGIDTEEDFIELFDSLLKPTE
jgi:hypothetical protein